MKIIKYYKIYRWVMGYFEEASEWYYQTLELAEKEVEDWKEDWIINEVEMHFHDNGFITIDEETVLERGE